MSHLTHPVDRTSANPVQDHRTGKSIQTVKGREESPVAKAMFTGSQGSLGTIITATHRTTRHCSNICFPCTLIKMKTHR